MVADGSRGGSAEGTGHGDGQSAPFILLCSHERERAYRPVLDEATYPIQLAHSPDDVLTQCVQDPPLGILIDVLTAMRLDRQSLGALSNLNVSWPIVRCNTNEQGVAMAMSVELQKRQPLAEALAAIAQGDSSWRHPTFRRRFVRLETQCRVLVRSKGDQTWRRSNALNIGVGGVFVVAYEGIAAGQVLELQLYDLGREPLAATGRVSWVRQWDDGPQCPGAGVQFEGGAVDPRLKEALGNPLLLARLRLQA